MPISGLAFQSWSHISFRYFPYIVVARRSRLRLLGRDVATDSCRGFCWPLFCIFGCAICADTMHRSSMATVYGGFGLVLSSPRSLVSPMLAHVSLAECSSQFRIGLMRHRALSLLVKETLSLHKSASLFFLSVLQKQTFRSPITPTIHNHHCRQKFLNTPYKSIHIFLPP
jgi:hypothetical protein